MVKITKILPKRFVSMNVLEFNNEFLLEKINEKINENILNRKLHINNCTIGFCLNWERIPNQYNSELYDSLNFFHK